MAVEVQPLDRRASDGDEEETGLEVAIVHPSLDAFWTSVLDIADVDSLGHRLSTWESVSVVPEMPGCVRLVGLYRAKPDMALTDNDCPTLCVVHHLQHILQWRPVNKTVVHCIENKKDLVFGREAVRMKKYYVAYIYLSRCLGLTSRMPSQQPELFYVCLLNGLRVEPFLGNKHYRDVFNRAQRDHGREPLPLPPPEPAPPLEYEDDDNAIMVPQDPEPAKKKKEAEMAQ